MYEVFDYYDDYYSFIWIDFAEYPFISLRHTTIGVDLEGKHVEMVFLCYVDMVVSKFISRKCPEISNVQY